VTGAARGAAGAVFTSEDLAQLEARGIPLAEAERQLALLAKPSHFLRIERPCTSGDGIEAPQRAGTREAGDASARGPQAIAAGRVTRFVPASGAASRMFADLERLRAADPPSDAAALTAMADAGDADARALRHFLDSATRFAFWDDLAAQVGTRGGDATRLLAAREWRPLLGALLDEPGMGAAHLPKGLLPFHRERGEVRTAFDEQLAEAALQADSQGVVRAHFTVTDAHRAGFEHSLARARARRPELRFEIGFSAQSPSTDTLAAGAEGGPFRLDDGSLLFRPAGHGAIIQNLNALGADLVFIKNIDNVVPDRLKAATLEWSAHLLGMAASLEEKARAVVRSMESGNADLDQVRTDLETVFGRRGTPATRDALIDAWRRPIRVCGMVKNTGEPGGGPYFLEDAAAGPQIVESAQVDMGDPEQAPIFRRATHFNPVFMACALHDPDGRPYDLRGFVDASAVIVTKKSAQGRPLLALERPGLWNGAMAGWNSVFVEVPGGVFNPVKTVFDMLRAEHQPA